MSAAQETEIKYHPTGYWWFVLGFTGVLSLAFNLWSVFDPPSGVTASQAGVNAALGIIAHACPVVLSAVVSHGFNTPLLGKWERRVIIVMFLAFMGVSVSSQAALLQHPLGTVGGWAVPVAIDVIALLALRAILNAHRINKEIAARGEQRRDEAAVEARIRPRVEAQIRTEQEASLPALRGDIERAVWGDILDRLGCVNEGVIEGVTGGVKTLLEGGDTEAKMTLLQDVLRGVILKEAEGDFRVRQMEREEEIRNEERQAALVRWNEAQDHLRSEIEHQVRRELVAAGKGKSQKAISGSEPKLTREDKERIVREAIEAGDIKTRQQLADEIGVSLKTLDRIKATVREQMGLSDGDKVAHLRAV